MANDIKWFVGIDWASRKHRVCLLDGHGRVVAERDIAHDGKELSELCRWLLKKTRATAGEIGVAIETTRGPVVEVLLERGFQVYAMNPKQLDRFRDRFTVAGAKDDSRDGHALGDALRTDRHALRLLTVDDPLVIELREWSRMGNELEQERNRLTNRMREQLWRYYPQMLELTNDLGDNWFLDLWSLVPTPAVAATITETAIATLLKRHRIRRIDAAWVRLQLQHQPVTVAAGTVEAATAHIRALAARINLVNEQLKEVSRSLDGLCAKLEAGTEGPSGQRCEQRDVAILRSCPGIGPINLATLLAEAWEPLQRRDYHALRILCGVAPVTRRSGRSCRVTQRLACNNRLRNTAYHWARTAMQHDPASTQRYAEQRRRGHSHGRALRGLADRLLAMLCILLERQVLFDPMHASKRLASAA
jgi:transposase